MTDFGLREGQPILEVSRVVILLVDFPFGGSMWRPGCGRCGLSVAGSRLVKFGADS